MIWILVFGLLAVLAHLALSSGVPLLTAAIVCRVIYPVLKQKSHIYWIIPMLNASVWEFFLRDEIEFIYLGPIFGVMSSLVGTAAVHGWFIRNSTGKGYFPQYDLLVKVIPVVVFAVGFAISPTRLQFNNFDQIADQLADELPAAQRKDLDNALKLLFARAKCHRHCKHPDQCSAFALFHRGKTAEQLIADGDVVAADLRLNYGCRVRSLEWELDDVAVTDARYFSAQGDKADRPKLSFKLQNSGMKRNLLGIYGSVTVTKDGSAEQPECVFSVSIPKGLKRKARTECVVSLPQECWHDGNQLCDVPDDNGSSCKVRILGVVTESEVVDYRPLLVEKSRCEKSIHRIDIRRYDYPWQHLSVDPDYQRLHGPNVDLVELRNDSQPFFPRIPVFENVFVGQWGHLDSGYSVKGRFAKATKDFEVKPENDDWKLVGYRFNGSDYELFFFPTSAKVDPNPAGCQVQISTLDGRKNIVQLQ